MCNGFPSKELSREEKKGRKGVCCFQFKLFIFQLKKRCLNHQTLIVFAVLVDNEMKLERNGEKIVLVVGDVINF